MNRPLSPHLSVYKFLINMMMSIAHRITGSLLYFGMFIFLILIISIAAGENYFNIVAYIFSTWFGKIIIFGITWALFHHMLGGLRHLVWDNVKGFDLKNIDLLAIGTLFGGILLTLIFWVLYFIM
tara:strand:+ start:12085 stop:12459 length:375 start_codon:yes stop_codon:yes gene_type:complete